MEFFNMKYTPDKITSLQPNEVFVFGSNEAGVHGAGAALLARQKFGAVLGQGFGLYGQSFAIPTKNYYIYTLAINKIKTYVDHFLVFAEGHPHLTFYVTQIGCGLAGHSPKHIAPLFKDLPDNVIIPRVFSDIINN